MTAMFCGNPAGSTERLMVQALGTEPVDDGDRLVFDDGEVRLVYETFREPSAADLFAILGNPTAAVDEGALPSAETTGSVPPEFEMLAELPSPSPDVELWIGVLDGSICLVHGTAPPSTKSAQLRVRPPSVRRHLAFPATWNRSSGSH